MILPLGSKDFFLFYRTNNWLRSNKINLTQYESGHYSISHFIASLPNALMDGGWRDFKETTN